MSVHRIPSLSAIYILLLGFISHPALCNGALIPDIFAHEELSEDEFEAELRALDMDLEGYELEEVQHEGIRDLEGHVEEMFDLTIISHATSDKIYFLPELVVRFKGDIVIGLFVTSEERRSVEKLVQSMGYPSRVRVTVHEGDGVDPYPVNMLRNLGIEAVTTSHFLMVDLDLLPSTTLFDKFEGLAPAVKRHPRLALVVPAFEIKNYNCKENLDCFESNRPHLPKNKIQLLKCIENERCGTFYARNALATHSTTDYSRWYDAQTPYEISCFQNVRYEPYVILKKTKDTPRFNEKFSGYGKNKIQHINHLRFAGYRFHVIPTAFIIHMPHSQSRSKHEWKRRGTGQKLSMDRLFKNFKKYLEKTYHGSERLQLCDNLYA